MEDLSKQIETDYIEAYKAKDELKVSVLRLLKTGLKNAEIAKKAKLSSLEVVDVIKKEAKQRRESAQVYQNNGQTEAADKELAEIKILEKYLPVQLSEREIKIIVDETAKSSGFNDISQMGQLIGKVMTQHRGKVDGSVVSKLAKEYLSQ